MINRNQQKSKSNKGSKVFYKPTRIASRMSFNDLNIKEPNMTERKLLSNQELGLKKYVEEAMKLYKLKKDTLM